MLEVELRRSLPASFETRKCTVWGAVLTTNFSNSTQLNIEQYYHQNRDKDQTKIFAREFG
jgi:hypothetical protein